MAAFRAHSSDELLLPASVYVEILVGPLRHGQLAVASLEKFAADFAMQIVPLTSETRGRAPSTSCLPALARRFCAGDSRELDAATLLTGDAT